MKKTVLVVLNAILVAINFDLYMASPEKNVLNLLIAGIWFVVFLINLFGMKSDTQNKDE